MGAESDKDIRLRLVSPLRNRMIRTIWRILRDPDDADEALQEGLTLTWKRLDRILRHPNPTALILRMCTDTARGIYRKRTRRSCHEVELSSTIPFTNPYLSASYLLESKEESAEILEAICDLPRQQATAAYLRFVEGESFGTLAQALNCSEATARMHVNRARAKLRRKLAHLLPNLEEQEKKS